MLVEPHHQEEVVEVYSRSVPGTTITLREDELALGVAKQLLRMVGTIILTPMRVVVLLPVATITIADREVPMRDPSTIVRLA